MADPRGMAATTIDDQINALIARIEVLNRNIKGLKRQIAYFDSIGISTSTMNAQLTTMETHVSNLRNERDALRKARNFLGNTNCESYTYDPEALTLTIIPTTFNWGGGPPVIYVVQFVYAEDVYDMLGEFVEPGSFLSDLLDYGEGKLKGKHLAGFGYHKGVKLVAGHIKKHNDASTIMQFAGCLNASVGAVAVITNYRTMRGEHVSYMSVYPWT